MYASVVRITRRTKEDLNRMMDETAQNIRIIKGMVKVQPFDSGLKSRLAREEAYFNELAKELARM